MASNESATPCPRCGQPVQQSGRGRPRVWCSQQCRRAAYEARRAARQAEQPVEVIEVPRPTPPELYGLHEHVQAVLAHPSACRRVLHQLSAHARDGTLHRPEWAGTLPAIHTLLDAL